MFVVIARANKISKVMSRELHLFKRFSKWAESKKVFSALTLLQMTRIFCFGDRPKSPLWNNFVWIINGSMWTKNKNMRENSLNYASLPQIYDEKSASNPLCSAKWLMTLSKINQLSARGVASSETFCTRATPSQQHIAGNAKADEHFSHFTRINKIWTKTVQTNWWYC